MALRALQPRAEKQLRRVLHLRPLGTHLLEPGRRRALVNPAGGRHDFAHKPIVRLVVVAALVIIVDQVLKAFAYELSKTLSVFVGLIITNCIIMGRFEAFALGNGPYRSFLDGIGNAAGYGLILVIVGFFRELLGSGTLLGYKVLGDPIAKTGLYAIGYENNGFMLLSPMALIVVGIIIWVQRSRNKELIEEN